MAFNAPTVASVTTAGGNAGTGTTPILNLAEMVNLSALLEVTAASGDASDELDAWLQGRIGGQWHDICHWNRLVSEGTTSPEVRRVLGSDVTTAAEALKQAHASNALGDNLVNNGPWGDALRVYYKVTDADNDSAFTFTVKVFAEG